MNSGNYSALSWCGIEFLPRSMRLGKLSRFRSLKAFTLVELLVVVGIIAVLIGILLPAIMAARRHAQRVQCAINLRTMGQIAAQYANDWNGVWPRVYQTPGPNGLYQFSHWHLMLAYQAKVPLPTWKPPWELTTQEAEKYARDIVPILAKVNWLQCPAYPGSPRPTVVTPPLFPPFPLDYVANFWERAVVDIARPIHKFKTSSDRTVLYTERTASTAPLQVGSGYEIYTPDTLPGGNSVVVLTDNRHGGLINMCFFDGHVEAKPWKNLVPADFDIRP